MAPRPFVINVATILRNRHSRHETITAQLPDLFVTGSAVPAGVPVVVDVDLHPVGNTVEARGTVTTTWEGDCVRCLKPATGTVKGEVRETFETDYEEGDTYPLAHDEIDLEPLARETVLLELPQVPLCRDDCAGLCPHCGADRNERSCDCAPPTDPRWAALDQLRDPSQ